MTIAESIGIELKRLRVRKGLSQRDLAKQLSVTRQSISDWERGKTQPSLQTLVKLKILYKLNMDNFMNEVINNVL